MIVVGVFSVCCWRFVCLFIYFGVCTLARAPPVQNANTSRIWKTDCFEPVNYQLLVSAQASLILLKVSATGSNSCFVIDFGQEWLGEAFRSERVMPYHFQHAPKYVNVSYCCRMHVNLLNYL